MKLTAEELEQGRTWVRAGNIDALERWGNKRGIFISKAVLHDTLGHAMKLNTDLAIKLFDKVYGEIDPEFDRRVVYWQLAFKLTLFLIVALGCLGGIVYLIKAVF